jgi:hypothetical protein
VTFHSKCFGARSPAAGGAAPVTVKQHRARAPIVSARFQNVIDSRRFPRVSRGEATIQWISVAVKMQ